MTKLLTMLAKTIAHREQGFFDSRDFAIETLPLLHDAFEEHDPDFAAAVLMLAQRNDLGLDHFHEVSVIVKRALFADTETSLADETPLSALREATVDHVRRAISGGADPEHAALLVARLPPEWCTPEFFRFAVTTELSASSRLQVDQELLPVAIHREGSRRSFRALVEPYFQTEGPRETGLIASAYLNKDFQPRERSAIREWLRNNFDNGATEDMIRVAARLSIEFHDDTAAKVALSLSERNDFGPHHSAILGLILWIAGRREDAAALSETPTQGEDSFGWGSQATYSIRCFLRASNEKPSKVIEWLTPSNRGDGGFSVATVGAMVGRMAILRMRSYIALGDSARAAREASVVLLHHGYRRYVLHTQNSNGEFEVELVSRLAITPDELCEARRVLESFDDKARWSATYLAEGVLFQQEIRTPAIN